MMLTAKIRAIFIMLNANSISPYKRTKHIFVPTTKSPNTVIHTALLIVTQNSTSTAAATISAGMLTR